MLKCYLELVKGRKITIPCWPLTCYPPASNILHAELEDLLPHEAYATFFLKVHSKLGA